MFIYRLLLKFRFLYDLYLSNEADALLFICIKLKSSNSLNTPTFVIDMYTPTITHHTQGDSYVTTDEEKSEDHSIAVYGSEVKMISIRRPVSKGFITSPQQQSSLDTIVEQPTPHEQVVSRKAFKKHPPIRQPPVKRAALMPTPRVNGCVRVGDALGVAKEFTDVYTSTPPSRDPSHVSLSPIQSHAVDINESSTTATVAKKGALSTFESRDGLVGTDSSNLESDFGQQYHNSSPVSQDSSRTSTTSRVTSTKSKEIVGCVANNSTKRPSLKSTVRSIIRNAITSLSKQKPG